MRIKSGTAEADFSFTQSSAGNLTLGGLLSMSSEVIITSGGELLWEKIDAGTNLESWSEVTHTGDTWSEVSAGGTIETWTEMVK